MALFKIKFNKNNMKIYRFIVMVNLMVICTGFCATNNAYGHAQTRSTSEYVSRTALQQTLNNLTNSGTDIDELSVSPNGHWVIVAGKSVYRSAGVPQALIDKVFQYIGAGRRIDAIAISDSGAWVVAAEDLFWRSSGVPLGNDLQTVVKNRQNAGRRIDEIVFTPNDGFIVLSEGYYHARRSPSKLYSALQDTKSSKRKPRRISFGADGRWVLLSDQAFASGGLNSTTYNRLTNWQQANRSLDHVVLGVGNNHILYSHANTVIPQDDLLQAVEYDLTRDDGTTANIWERMEEANVPGVTLAIIENNKVKYARGYGLLEAGNRDRFVKADSPYPVASLSKYVTAVGLARVSQEDGLSFFADIRSLASVHDGGHLDLWKTFGEDDNFYGTDLPWGMRLDRLMRHEASINTNDTNAGWGGYLTGTTQFSTWQILLGYGCSGDNCNYLNRSVWYDPNLNSPSTASSAYSNGGYELIRAAMEDHLNENFINIMDEKVFTPLGMNNSTYDQPLSGSYESRAAEPHDENGNAIARDSYQWLAGGGLYTTPEDYAKAMLVIMDQDKSASDDFLGQYYTDFLLRDPNDHSDDTVNRYSGGINISHTPLTDSTVNGRFAHGGYLPDMSRARMVGSPIEGKGLVAIINADTPETPRLLCEIERSFRDAAGIPLISCN
ncbi:serine hydrolase domain-containing protein [Agarilytica rhodophyticola]|uniref:serine hydrolase domain-containing protein n=1 Tax=Agarilytica rhodophyticola TaxID=1737490 RepID=UPI000B346310|nr:serine hydrolase domain-containing protein [Agarilytica rhodophyticola]